MYKKACRVVFFLFQLPSTYEFRKVPNNEQRGPYPFRWTRVTWTLETRLEEWQNSSHFLSTFFLRVFVGYFGMRAQSHQLSDVKFFYPNFIPKPRTNYLKNSFSYTGAVLWNSLPAGLRQAKTLESFKAGLRQSGHFTTISYSFQISNARLSWKAGFYILYFIFVNK